MEQQAEAQGGKVERMEREHKGRGTEGEGMGRWHEVQ